VSASTIREDIVNLPNLLTLARIAIIPVVCVFLAWGDPMSCLWAVILFTLAGLTDWFDGYIARKRGLISLTGKFLDPLADKLLVMAVLIMLLRLGRISPWESISPWLVILILSREISVTSLRTIAAGEGMIIAAGEGGKFKTAFQITGLQALMVHYIYEVDYGFITVEVNFLILGFWLLVISTVFSMISGFQYFYNFVLAIEDRREEIVDDR
jgi:CDP-diacylglycerol--glycerol-3-phosphate 3-phosphatidyltransferase